jgi:hypothetical protein
MTHTESLLPTHALFDADDKTRGPDYGPRVNQLENAQVNTLGRIARLHQLRTDPMCAVQNQPRVRTDPEGNFSEVQRASEEGARASWTG